MFVAEVVDIDQKREKWMQGEWVPLRMVRGERQLVVLQ